MKVVVYNPYNRVWTPRTPDTNYDSLGAAPLGPIVFLPAIAEGLGTGIGLEPGLYEVAKLLRGSSEGAGYGIRLLSGTYTPAT